MFSDLIFTVVVAPAQVQSHPASATSSIPEDPTIKGIFYAADAHTKVSATTTTSDTDTVTLVIPNYQVAMLSKKGDTLVDQGVKPYTTNYLMLSGRTSLDNGISKPTSNGENNTFYLLQPSLSPSYAKEEKTSIKLSASLMSSGERNKRYDTDDPSKCNGNAGMEESSKWKMAP